MTPSTNKSDQEEGIPTPEQFLSTNEQFASCIEDDETDNIPTTLSGPIQNPTEKNTILPVNNSDLNTTRNQLVTQIVDSNTFHPAGYELSQKAQQKYLIIEGESPLRKLETKTLSSSSRSLVEKQVAKFPLPVSINNPTVATEMHSESSASAMEIHKQQAKSSVFTSTIRQQSQPTLNLNPNDLNNRITSETANIDVEARPRTQGDFTQSLEKTEMSPEPQVPSTVEVPTQLTFPRLSPPSQSLPKVGDLNLLSSKETRQYLNKALFHSQLHSHNQRGQVSPLQQPKQPSIQATTHSKSKPSNALRRGKWTVEEEAYVARVIQDFNSGYLNAPAGTTLRSYLSEKLHCDPMRITKKFTGDSCIGKRVFHPAVRCPSNTASIDKAQAELDALERRWRRRLEMQQRESAKKAAASAAAAAAAASGRTHFHASNLPASNPVIGISSNRQTNIAQHLQQSLVTQTATWLDRANTILSTGQTVAKQPEKKPPIGGNQDHSQAIKSLPQKEIEDQMKEIEDQMKEVQRLIHEGPIIQQTTAGLPHLLEQSTSTTMPQPTVGSQGEHGPVDKRLRRSSGNDESGAEDAEALVGFLNSVRKAAAASTTDPPTP